VSRALILSGSFGKGHDTVAEACAAALASRRVESRVLDSVALLGRRRARLGHEVFRRMLAVAPLYDAFHFSSLRVGGRLADRADSAALRNSYPRFVAEVDSFAPDLVLSVFATGAAAGARLKSERPGVRTAVFMTDSFAHRLWVHEGTDVFLVTSALAAASIRRFRPDANVCIVTAPARPAFYDAPSKADARRTLGLATDVPCVLLMSGGWGIGPLDLAARVLAEAGVRVLAVAGGNERLAERLNASAAANPAIVAFGFTDRIPELMAASDLVVTSSGDTCREARVVGRPIVLLDVVPGHGRENLMHELELGGAALGSTDPQRLVGVVNSVLRDPPAMEPERAREWENEFWIALASGGFTPPG